MKDVEVVPQLNLGVGPPIAEAAPPPTDSAMEQRRTLAAEDVGKEPPPTSPAGTADGPRTTPQLNPPLPKTWQAAFELQQTKIAEMAAQLEDFKQVQKKRDEHNDQQVGQLTALAQGQGGQIQQLATQAQKQQTDTQTGFTDIKNLLADMNKKLNKHPSTEDLAEASKHQRTA